MKLSFNKKPVLDNTQLNLFSNEFSNGDCVWWNGVYPTSLISGSFGMDKFGKGYYGVVLDNKSLYFNNKQTVY